MPRIERTAETHWEGNLARGAGTLTAGSSGAFAGLAFTNASRIGNPEGKTSPEELLAAAHAACFTTSLAGELTRLGRPPGQLEVSCRIIMDEVGGQGHQIVGSQVSATVSAEGLDSSTLAEATRLADEGCPFSALLKRAGADVEIETTIGRA